MKYTEDNIIFEGIHEARLWQRGRWVCIDDGRKLFVQNTLTPWSFLEPCSDEFWLDGWQETEELLTVALDAHGLNPDNYYPKAEFYGDGFFPACRTFEHALEYANAVYNIENGC